MVYKGTIVKEERNFILVMTENCQYLKLNKKGKNQLGNEIMFLDEDIIKSKNNFKLSYGVAAVLVFLMITTVLFGGVGINTFVGTKVYAVVSLDINPSVEFKIDENNIVKEINPLNDDGKAIINSDMVGMSIEDAIYQGIENAIEGNYINVDNDTVLVSEAKIEVNTKLQISIKQKIVEKIEQSNSVEKIKLVYINSNEKSLKEAKESNVSIGKYELYKKIADKNKNISLNNIKEMNVTEIIREDKAITQDYEIKMNKKDKEEKEKYKEKDDDKKKDKEKKEENDKENGQNKGNGSDKEIDKDRDIDKVKDRDKDRDKDEDKDKDEKEQGNGRDDDKEIVKEKEKNDDKEIVKKKEKDEDKEIGKDNKKNEDREKSNGRDDDKEKKEDDEDDEDEKEKVKSNINENKKDKDNEKEEKVKDEEIEKEKDKDGEKTNSNNNTEEKGKSEKEDKGKSGKKK